MTDFNLSAHAKKVISERSIKIAWIIDTLNDPDKIEPDSIDKALEHRIKIIKEYDNKALRIVTNKSIKPVLIVTAFFDRRIKGKLL